MSQKIYSVVKLVEKRSLSKSYDRLVFEGAELAEFNSDCLGGYVKLLFDAHGVPLLQRPATDGLKPVMRSFTITAFDGQRLSIDVVSGKPCGVAAHWTERAKPGDTITLVGPGKSERLPPDYDAYFIAGDETAIPAIMVQLAAVDSAPGSCVLQAPAKAFDAAAMPANLAWRRVDPDSDGSAMVEAVREAAWPEGRVFVWAACEFEQMRALRRYFRNERQVARGDMYISSYWKRGETDEGNKRAKKLDSEAGL